MSDPTAGTKALNAGNSAANIGRGVAALSLGTVVVQACSMLSQFLFAIWLVPAQFGYWASATSLMALLSGLTNLGEVNGFLADAGSSYFKARKSINHANACLMVCGLAVAAVSWRFTNSSTALLVAILALNIPLIGLGNLLMAAHIRAKRNRSIVMAQVYAGLARIALGTLVVWCTHSVWAFGVSTTTYSVILILGLRSRLPASESLADLTEGPSLSQRSRWALTSLAQYLPSQADYVVLTFATSAAVLGVYFLAFQVTVGISSLTPLAKSTLATLSRLPEAERAVVFTKLVRAATGAVIIAAAGATSICLLAGPYLPQTWRPVATVAALLLASLPSRFLAPLTDARLLAAGRWTMGTIVNLIDAMGTGLAALIGIKGGLTVLAISIVVWKVAYGLARYWVVSSAEGPNRSMVIGLVILAAGLTIVSVKSESWFRYSSLLLAGICGAMMILNAHSAAMSGTKLKVAPTGTHRAARGRRNGSLGERVE